MPVYIVPVLMRVVVIVWVIVSMRVAVVMPVFGIDRFDARGRRQPGLRLRVQLLAEEKHQHRSQEREQRDQPDLVQKIHGSPTTSASRFHPPERFPYCETERSEYP